MEIGKEMESSIVYNIKNGKDVKKEHTALEDRVCVINYALYIKNTQSIGRVFSLHVCDTFDDIHTHQLTDPRHYIS